MITEAQLLELLTPGVIGGFAAGLIVLLIFIFIIVFLFLLGVYVYYCLVWFNIAKKFKYKNAWLAWIPIANLFLMPILAKKHWALGFLLLIPVVNLVFSIIWCWKIFEKLKYSGAWSLLVIGFFIPVLSFFAILAYLIIIGFMAFSK